MSPPRHRPVLVTGSNRSGTTWVGRMLCLSRELAYVHEPFNPGISPRWLPEPLRVRNLYICPDNEGPYVAPAQAVIERRFPWRTQIDEIRSARAAARLAVTGVRHSLGRVSSRATLVKDPIAVFSAEWLATRFDMDVVLMIRSPVAFVGSIKRLGWAFDFGHWANQELLMRDHLGEFAEEIRRAAAEPPSLLDQAILTWNATYAYVDRMQTAHPDWHIVDYEELAARPTDSFRALYGALDLHFDEHVARGIAHHSDDGNLKDVPAGDKGGIHRDSHAALETWRTRLTPEDIAVVEDRTRSVAARLGLTLRDAT